ncbi:MAG: hypothetical protein GAK43_02733 [Stenotrophomonas maltophilia]|nr:MAG: hypothetical protein GAK43_02733 [Stenotrophomonas maltophilia]
MPQEQRTQLLIDGPVGPLQLLVDTPTDTPRGIAMISHPQPLLGGSPRHVVPLTLARRLCEAGWLAVRPSFRGVDGSSGEYTGGEGEAQDSVAVADYLRERWPGLPLALVGFSFGAHVFARAAAALGEPPAATALLGFPVGEVPGGRHYPALPLPANCLLVHGEADEMAPLANLLDWARPLGQPVWLFPGSNHFFKGCLEPACDRVLEHLQRYAG